MRQPGVPQASVSSASVSLTSLLALIVFLSVVPAPAGAQELPFTHYTQDNELNPLPSADVRMLYQDRLGYIWFVVYSSGLLRYDGHSFETYMIEDGLLDLSVRQVTEDHEGRLWVAMDGGLVVSELPLQEYLLSNRIRFTSSVGATELIHQTIIQNRLAVDQEGTVWVGTRTSGIIRYRPGGPNTLTADTIATDLVTRGRHEGVRSVFVRANGSVWVALARTHLLMFGKDGATPRLFTKRDGLPESETEVMYETAQGVFYGGCRNGTLWRLKEEKGGGTIEVVTDIPRTPIYSILESPDGALWIASDGAGVMRLREDPPGQSLGNRMRFTRRNGLLSDNVNHMLHDREGNLWFSQLGGVSKLRVNYRAFTTFTASSHAGERPLLPNPGVNAVLPPSLRGPLSAGVWVGTSGGGVGMIRDDGERAFIQSAQGLPSDWVNGVVLDARGRLWIGTLRGITGLSVGAALPGRSHHVRRLALFDQPAFLSGYGNTSIYSCRVFSLKADETGTRTIESIWFAGYQNLFCLAEDEWFVFKSSSGLPPTFLNDVTMDDQGNVWVGMRDEGLYRSVTPITLAMLRGNADRPTASVGSQGENFAREVTATVFERAWSRSIVSPAKQIQSLVWRNGNLWIATPQGIVVLEGDVTIPAAHITVEHGLRANNVGSLDFSPVTGFLWAGTNAGLAEIDPKQRKVLRTVTKQDGLVDNEVWFFGSVRVGLEGEVYFGTAKGLSRYRPHLDKKNTELPMLRLRQATLREDNTGSNAITFSYAALSFGNERLVRYRTRLVGYDREWSPPTADVRIRYTNLPAVMTNKTYVFEVMACNNDSVWTETPLSYAFAIQPAWWFRWWSFAVYVVLFAGTVIGISRFRNRQLRRRGRELEAIVEQRTHEIRVKAEENLRQAEQLAEANKDLEEMNQEIIRTQEQLIMQEKLASLGALTAGIAHEIKNPLNFVNNFAELTVELIDELREDLAKFLTDVDSKDASNIEANLKDLAQNASKITEHGKRADSIVRGMLLHSRGKSGERMPTDINTLLDEYVTLAYHGLRAQDSNFNVTIERDYDKSIEQVNIVPQDLSRVFLNIINNACYAANEKKLQTGGEFSPTLSVKTMNLGKKVEIRIRDNGNGIPKEIRDKIFEPFFTTKPTGKGTGLGLSLSYDIVVKEHKGEIRVDTKPGEFTEFVLTIPKNV